MPSEHRLHPASIVFRLAGQVREFAVPLVVAVVAGSRGNNFEVWAVLVLIPYTLFAVARYYSLRYRFEPHELVVRNVLVFRNERHIPYSRIQNLDAVRNVVHRALGVVDVRVETGSGAGEDARLSVITWEAYEEMRRRVFAGREAAGAEPGQEAMPASQPHVLLELPARELVLLGLIDNRGTVVIAGLFGLLWELGVAEGLIERFFSEDAAAGGLIRDVLTGLVSGTALPWSRVGLAVAVLAGVLILIRALSVCLVVLRLHGFRLVRTGEDLRAEYGLLTRVSATIPLRRVQTLTISDGPLLRWFGRATVRVDTAGGANGRTAERRRESLAPIVGRDRLPDIVASVLPELDAASAAWHPAAPGASTREVRARLVLAALFSALFIFPLGWHAIWVFGAVAILAVVSGLRYVAHFGWASITGAVLFRSGWLWRHQSVARFTRIQSVALVTSPFDRRWRMAQVRVDTAGAGATSHRVHVPYLTRETADRLRADLAGAAARTEFRW